MPVAAPPTGRPSRAVLRRWFRVASLLGLALLVVSSCDNADTVLGACVIQAGEQCEGNYMRHADLKGADLYGANLSHADLSSADLSGANLSGTDLRRAKMMNVQLQLADLDSANLKKADLRNANLAGAMLFYANLTGARLNGYELAGAYVCDTILPDGTIANPGCNALTTFPTAWGGLGLHSSRPSNRVLKNAVLTGSGLAFPQVDALRDRPRGPSSAPC